MKDRRGQVDNSREHMYDLQASISGIKNGYEVIDPEICDQLCLEEYSSTILKSNLLQIPLNMDIKGSEFSLEMQGLIVRIQGEENSRKTVMSTVNRKYGMFTDEGNWTSIYNSGNAVGSDITGDLIVNDLHGVGWRYSEAGCMANMHGSNISQFDFDNIHGILSIKAKQADYRMIAVKGFLLLQQLITCYTFTDSEVHAQEFHMNVNYSPQEEVQDRSIDHDLVLDMSLFQEDECELLFYLTRKWPFQKCKLHGQKDIYSSVLVEEDDVIFYTSHDETIRIGNGRGIVMPPDDYFHRLVNLFTALDAVDQLFNVIKEMRGVIPFLNLCHAKEKESITLRYPKSCGINSFSGIAPRNNVPKYTRVSQLLSSSAHLLLDMLMGVQGINNIHCIGEQMGIYNKRMFNENPITENNTRITSLMRDHSFTLDGPTNKLQSLVLPWAKGLLSIGTILRDSLYVYQGLVRANNLRNRKDHNNTCLILTRLNPNPIPLSTSESINEPQEFRMESKGTHLSGFRDIGLVCKVVNWCSAVGLDQTGVSFGGLSWICEDSYPQIDNVMRQRISPMEGLYSLRNVSTTVQYMVARRGATSGHVSSLFREVTHGEAHCVADKSSDDMKRDSVQRIYSSSQKESVSAHTLPATNQPNKQDTYDPFKIAYDYDIGPDVLGDGNCGLRALSAAINGAGTPVTPEDLANKQGLDMKVGYWQDDEDLAALSSSYGYNLLILSDVQANYYDMNKKADLVLYHTGGNHWRPGVKSKNPDYEMPASAVLSKGNKVVDTVKIKAKVDKFVASRDKEKANAPTTQS